MLDGRGLGRFAQTARLVLAALHDGPRQHVRLFDEVRALDGPVGPGTLYGAVARLERLGLIEATKNGGDAHVYRLIGSGLATGGAPAQEGNEA